MKLFRNILLFYFFAFNISAQQLFLYKDSLLIDYWDANYSWNTNFNLYSKDFVYEGLNSISIEYRQPFAGFSIFTANQNTSGYDTLVFFVNGGNSSGQSFQVKVSYDGKNFNSGLNISNYVFIEANKWKEVRIALKDFGADNNFIELLAFQENKGFAQQKFYIDYIYLKGPDGVPKILESNLSSYNPYPGELINIKVKIENKSGLFELDKVYVDLSELGMSGSFLLYDDGLHNDNNSGDGVFGGTIRIKENTYRGEYRIQITAETKQKLKATEKIWIGVLSKLKKEYPSGLPGYLSIGTATTSADLQWQSQNGGSCWDMGYQYVTWEWWTWDPQFVLRFCNNAANRGYIPVIPIYKFQPAASKFGCNGDEYENIYCALNNAQLMTEFWNRFIQMCQEANSSSAVRVIFHFEPDMLGYLQKRGRLENKTPAQLTAIVNDTNYPNTLAGMMKRIADLINIYCPGKGLFANHISLWSNDISIKDSKETYLNVDSLAKKTYEFLLACTDKADLFFIDWSDRDAGFDGIWWNKRNTSVPNFSRAVLFANCFASYMNKKLILWQVPIGNESLDNSVNHFRDNRLDYIFDYPKDIVKSGVISVLFGAAIPNMTTQETDGGNLVRRAKQYCSDGKISFEQLDSVSLNIPDELELVQNYPNPFRFVTYLDIKLPVIQNPDNIFEQLYKSRATIKIYNTLGQLVAVIFDEIKNAGYYKGIKFAPQEFNLPSGMYIARLTYGQYSNSKKLLYIR